MDELQSIMDALLPIIKIKTQYTQSIFDLWFGEMKLIELTEDRATFSTTSGVKVKILGTKYKAMIEEALSEIIGFKVNAEFTSVVEEFKEEPETPPEPPKPTEESRLKQKEIEEIINRDISKKSLLDEYTFDNFIEGDSNKFARAACLAVAKEPTTYNPLFIYGHSGLGKTHLLYAVINYIKHYHPAMKIVYKKSEDFINEMIAALSDGTIASFKERYRSADVLLIDDIQFLAGKETMQEEFFHTFSALYESDKQIILTSDRPPKEIKPLEDRLRTRFEGGLLADVQPPSYELRTAIIKKKCETIELEVSPEQIDYMAERLHNNIRQIEGVIKRLNAVCRLTDETVTKELIDDVISIIDPGNVPTDVLIEKILSSVSKKYGVTVDDLKSKKKTDNIANARHVAIYIIRHETNLPLKEIGAVFSRDHTTIMSSLNKVEINIKTVKNYESDINSLIKEVKA